MFKLIPSSLYGALALFFFLPFIQIKCNDTILAESSGLKVSIGGKPAFKDPMMETYAGQGDGMEKIQEQNKANPVLIAFAALVVLGLAFSLFTKRDLHLGNTVFSCIIAVILLAFMIQIYIGNKEIGKQMSGMQNGLMRMNISINLAYGYWLSLISAFSLIIFSIIMLSKHKKPKLEVAQIDEPAASDAQQEIN